MGIGDILVILILLAAVIGAFALKKKHKGCCGNCAECARKKHKDSEHHEDS